MSPVIGTDLQAGSLNAVTATVAVAGGGGGSRWPRYPVALAQAPLPMLVLLLLLLPGHASLMSSVGVEPLGLTCYVDSAAARQMR